MVTCLANMAVGRTQQAVFTVQGAVHGHGLQRFAMPGGAPTTRTGCLCSAGTSPGCGDREEAFVPWLGWSCAGRRPRRHPLKIKREVGPWNGQILCIWCAPASKTAPKNSAYPAQRSCFAAPGLRLGGGLRRRRTGVGGLGVAAVAARAFSFRRCCCCWQRVACYGSACGRCGCIAPPEGEEITAEDARNCSSAGAHPPQGERPAIHHVARR